MGKNLRYAENYNIGLDIGTGSVGWAVTDKDGELYHFKGKPTWGSRLFPSAVPASVARIPRGQRRRYDRRRQRLDLLQELFCEDMQAVDAEFFIRLKQSRLLPEDREDSHRDYRWPLFNGDGFTEQDYYQKFPSKRGNVYEFARVDDMGEKWSLGKATKSAQFEGTEDEYICYSGLFDTREIEFMNEDELKKIIGRRKPGDDVTILEA